jgi:hypothetical protein
MVRTGISLPRTVPIVPTGRHHSFNDPAWLFKAKYEVSVGSHTEAVRAAGSTPSGQTRREIDVTGDFCDMTQGECPAPQDSRKAG